MWISNTFKKFKKRIELVPVSDAPYSVMVYSAIIPLIYDVLLPNLPQGDSREIGIYGVVTASCEGILSGSERK